MNYNNVLVKLVARTLLIYFLVSVLVTLLGISWRPMDNINLVSEVLVRRPERPGDWMAGSPSNGNNAVKSQSVLRQDFNSYTTPGRFISFRRDTAEAALAHFVQKLYEHKKGLRKKKIRVAYFGDSLIEGDLIVGTFRSLMQKQFGGTGVGFVPVKCVSSGYRQTATSYWSGNWSEVNFKSSAAPDNLFLSGMAFQSRVASLEMMNKVRTNSAMAIEKRLFTGKAVAPLGIYFENGQENITPVLPFNNILLKTDTLDKLRISFPASAMPVYGVSFEGESGIIIDNFSFRGITGMENGKISSEFLAAIQQSLDYDLILFQYGVNLLFRPNDTQFDYYKKLFAPVVAKFKAAFPETDIAMISTADRAFRYGSQFQSAVGVEALVKVQATIAYDAQINFFNLYQTMGGRNAMVRWANQKPSLANKDYIHFNAKGAEKIGEFLFKALMKEYQAYESAKESHNPQHQL